MSRPLWNVAHSTLLVPPPNREQAGSHVNFSAARRATAAASESMAPTAVAMESMKRRFASWTASAGRSSKRSWRAYSARRSARGVIVPSRTGRTTESQRTRRGHKKGVGGSKSRARLLFTKSLLMPSLCPLWLCGSSSLLLLVLLDLLLDLGLALLV